MARGVTDLHNHLFAQLEKLSDEDLPSEELEEEILRAKGIIDIAKTIIDVANLQIKAESMLGNGVIANRPKLLE